MKTNGQKLYEAIFPSGAYWDTQSASTKFDYEQKALTLIDEAVKARTVELQAALAQSEDKVKALENAASLLNQTITQRNQEVAVLTTQRDQLQGQVNLLTAPAATPAP